MTIKVTEQEKCISDVKINLMMQNSAEHAQLWPHAFIILTEGSALILHEAEKRKKREKKGSGRSTAALKDFSFNIHVYSLYKQNLAANQV